VISGMRAGLGSVEGSNGCGAISGAEAAKDLVATAVVIG
jgi:hypothetical protein